MSNPESSKDRLLNAAECLFGSRGYGAVSLAEIAKSAQLGKATLFHHFPTKAHLYSAVVVRVVSFLEVELLRALATGGSPTMRLNQWIDSFINVLAAHPAYSGILMRVLTDEVKVPDGLVDGDEALKTVNRTIGMALNLLREGMDCGEFVRMSASHVLQSIIGAIVHPLSTGKYGEKWIGESLFSENQIARRKTTLKLLLGGGLGTITRGDRHETNQSEITRSLDT